MCACIKFLCTVCFQIPKADSIESPGMGGCEPSDVGAVSQTQVLCTSS